MSENRRDDHLPWAFRDEGDEGEDDGREDELQSLAEIDRAGFYGNRILGARLEAYVSKLYVNAKTG
jgi:hypothetical protein